MALNNNKEQYLKILKKTILAVILLIIVIVNAVKFNNLIATNPQKITEYQAPVDIYAQLRNPRLAVTYYDLAEKKPKIVILPYQKFIQSMQKFDADNVRNKAVWIQNKFKISEDFSLWGDVAETVFYQKISQKQKEYLKSFAEKPDNVLIFVEDVNDKESSEALSAAEYIATKLNLLPVTKNLLKEKDIVLDKSVAKNNYGLQEQYENLRSFVNDYKEPLITLISQAKQHKKVEKSFYENKKHLFDKAAVLVLALDEKMGVVEKFGSTDFNNSVAQGIYAGVSSAQKAMPAADIKVFILTEKSRAENYATETDFKNVLKEGDGVVVEYGNRTGFLPPFFWYLYPNKQEFVKQLKLESGLSPDYWSEQINVYYFKAVEIVYYEN